MKLHLSCTAHLAIGMMAVCALLSRIVLAAAPPDDHGYLEFGGSGNAAGKFADVRDLAFSPDNSLYVLEGGNKTHDFKQLWPGNLRIQKFDNNGKFLAQFSLADEALGKQNDPQRIAVDSLGDVFVTQPKANIVREFSPDGKKTRDITVPLAFAITRAIIQGHETIAVLANADSHSQFNGKPFISDTITTIESDGSLGHPIKLTQALTNAQDMAADPLGNLYVLADVNQIYKFDATGKLIAILGTGTNTRAEDGSELLHSVAVDSHGNIYSMTFGNPGKIVKFDAALSTVTAHAGMFDWFDAWSLASGYVPLAVDNNDRLWAVSVNLVDHPLFSQFHYRPVVLRAPTDFFAPGKIGVTQNSTLTMGFKPWLAPALPYGIAYDLQPFSADLVIGANRRNVRQATAEYHIYDVYKTEVSQGKFDLALQDGIEARHIITFTPPKFGWYTFEIALSSGGQPLTAFASHVGITPKFPTMPTLAPGESTSGWEDAPRMAFIGLTNMRLHPAKGLDKFDHDIDAANKYKLTFFGQLTDKKSDLTPEIIGPIVKRFKGRVPVWEIYNEPNLTMSVNDYVAALKILVPLIKGIDPQTKIMGPDACGIDLNWYQNFYELGGKDLVDILSIHDYEGHETIDPVHWRWKIGALRQIMAKFGDQAKPIWQTERGISGVRGANFIGDTQAIRTTLHYDLLQSLGIPPEHNNYYYLNEGGYAAVPTYLWSSSGPHPGALALRTRAALTSGTTYSGTVDFGPTGNKLFLGLRYTGAEGSTIILRNLGTLDQTMLVQVRGGSSLEVVDAFGNSSQVAVSNGTATLQVQQFPQYLQLTKGQDVEFPTIDFGQNIAPDAVITGSVPDAKNLKNLNNGIWETTFAGDPHGDTDGKKIFEAPLTDLPQTLDMTFSAPRRISRVLIAGMHADNAFCALLDYDLQYRDKDQWITIQQVRTPTPPSDNFTSSDCFTMTWDLDNNLSMLEFPPVMTNQLRLVIRRTTQGFAPDAVANAAVIKIWGGKGLFPELTLREIELYGPPK